MCSGLKADSSFQLLQQWFDTTVANAREMLFDCHHEKVSQSDTGFRSLLISQSRRRLSQTPRKTL